jgi:creatinine amidohydrolase
MGALILDTMTWPEVRDAIAGGRDLVVVPFGATEQHGHHLPLGTDAMLGDAIGLAVAERLDAFLAPTVRVGCSAHHLAFAGTLSVEEETFHRIVADLTRTLASHGFRRIVLLPTHGGNFRPIGDAAAKLGPVPGAQVIALSDLQILIDATLGLGREMGISAEEGGVHGGEWETSLMRKLRPDLVRMERAEPGFVGDLAEAVQGMFGGGVHAISANGVIGDPRRATAEAGERYFDALVDIVVRAVRAAEAG